MVTYVYDDKLLIHYFQDTLNEVSLEWYMRLKSNHVQLWRNLAKAFLKHYKYNTDMAANWTQLYDMSQKSNESYKEYDVVLKGARWQGPTTYSW